ncbi:MULTISPECIES: nitrogenase stabilizing/protective protein NifW [unclassified Methyloversatilis]|uniref:nitrogenase stabilizing/protective protein NifW n=1 Tax=unclassified Methyloversatilis TaxID=2639971 RepID=UPI00211C1372|nr:MULTISPECIES: nitrogenase stabilizing/protective protein NifW [unclassified Methyloversatilis]MCQ9378201.1 nitrogenase stabilizing/protective protein NifW [Methyloversatilis sp. XJ19-49]MDP2869210.1 nitrogenase stabilizing/protective protein NifW [Methyloversatilis sp.]MDP3290234.1 nitrogenase stabilizing/protective protein NifW [Methyloversatilis sp.]MDP3455323.1 nitrogenase stabilizing/protective protein NifW [Methyloversatilis sp.]MDP3578213.1 nitrogenase stabilizing/protective protein N
MDELTQRLATLSSAEDFLEFFALPFDQSVVNVNRLHILKRFYQYLRGEQGVAEGEPAVVYARYRGLLLRAYEDFVKSTPAQEKVFKVFQEADGQQRVSLESLRSTLPSVV